MSGPYSVLPFKNVQIPIIINSLKIHLFPSNYFSLAVKTPKFGTAILELLMMDKRKTMGTVEKSTVSSLDN